MSADIVRQVSHHVTAVIQPGKAVTECHIVQFFHIGAQLLVLAVQLILLIFNHQVGIYPGLQLPSYKRLLNIITGSHGKALHHILILILGGKEYNNRVIFIRLLQLVKQTVAIRIR